MTNWYKATIAGGGEIYINIAAVNLIIDEVTTVRIFCSGGPEKGLLIDEKAEVIMNLIEAVGSANRT